MSVEQLEQSILNLSDQDRHRLLDWLHEHEEELMGVDGVHPEVKAEVLRRRDEALTEPDATEAWATAYPRMRQQFDELRRQNPYPRRG